MSFYAQNHAKKTDTILSPVDQKFQYFYRTGDVWEAMFRECEQAEESILMEQYIFEADEIGVRFLELFASKAAQGINVRLIVDGVGSHALKNSVWLEKIRKAGGAICFFNDIDMNKIFLPARWFPRNHSKVLVVDSKIAYVGSACIAHSMADWRDVQVRIEDSLVKDIQDGFERTWGLTAKSILRPAREVASPLRGGGTRYVIAGGKFKYNILYKELLHRIRHAKKQVCMVTPYFMPPFLLRRVLRKAARRGVKVQIMVSEKTDVRIADYMARLYYPKMLRAGIHIYHFDRTVLHAKYVLIDGEWATVGSTNIDYLSLLRNREANIIIEDPRHIDLLQKHFDEDTADCKEAKVDDYREITWIHDALNFIRHKLSVRAGR